MLSRVKRLRARLADEGLPALLISNDTNRRYISGFTGSAGFLLVTADNALLLTDFRYTEQAAEQAPEFDVRLLQRGLLREFEGLQKELGLTRLGFESTHITYRQYQDMSGAASAAGIDLSPVENIVEPLRAVKDPDEIAAIERAVAIADMAVEQVSAAISPGQTELDVAWQIEKTMREAGAEGMAFEVIVGSGPRGAMPHARPTDRKIAAGEPIVLDLGCIVDGYRSDLTRTVCIGTPDQKYLDVWNLVLHAQREAETKAKPGMKAGEVDKIARDIIAEAGYGECFGHSLGHGIGLETHEGPFVRSGGEEILREGMVFSVEPGVYLPGEFGVRIEDLVILDSVGAQVLSKAKKTAIAGG